MYMYICLYIIFIDIYLIVGKFLKGIYNSINTNFYTEKINDFFWYFQNHYCMIWSYSLAGVWI